MRVGVGARVLERFDISNITFHSVDVLVFLFDKKRKEKKKVGIGVTTI